MSEIAAQMIATILCSILGSTGLWKYLEHRANLKRAQDEKNDVRNAMLRGLAHDRIMFLGMHYIDRGNITPDEFENLNDYLFVPYQALGGNGSAAKIMEDVRKLPVVPSTYKKKSE